MMSWMPADDGANTSRATPLPYRIAKEISPVFTAFAHATSVRCVEYIFVASVAQWIEHFSPKEGVVGSIPIWGTAFSQVSQLFPIWHALSFQHDRTIFLVIIN